MPSSAVRSVEDPYDYEQSMRGTKNELTIVGGGEFHAKITRVDFDRLWIQRVSEVRPRIMHSADVSGRATISFHTKPGPSLLRGGIEATSSDIVTRGKDHSYFERSNGIVHWGSMSLPAPDMQSVGIAVADCELASPTNEQVITPPPAALAKLQLLHAEAGQLAENAPEIIANTEAARGMEHALVDAMVDCLSPPARPKVLSAHRRHETIMRRFHAAISEHIEEPVYIAELCAFVGVPERTLRLCCYESQGMGPKRYLLLRRMNLARRALRNAASTTTVTAIAASFGFWNFGRFAAEYKALFGELPSTTLGNP
jgi:AraC-like DNA-binding protein